MNVRRRLDESLRILRRSGTATVSNLAEQLGVSRRTILRDIAELRDQGFQIHTEPGRGGGVRLAPESVQTTSRLSVTEVFALIISVASMRAGGSLPFSEYADHGLRKIEKSLSRDKVSDLRQLLDCLFFGQLSAKQDISSLGSVDQTLLPAFEQAFLQRRHLHFDYRDARGTATRRQIEPQAMLVLPPIWYLVGWDIGRNAFRHFRMDRICNARISEGAQFRRRHIPFEEDVCPFRDLAP